MNIVQEQDKLLRQERAQALTQLLTKATQLSVRIKEFEIMYGHRDRDHLQVAVERTDQTCQELTEEWGLSMRDDMKALINVDLPPSQ